MARALRVEYKGACYHVINRGNHQEIVFKDDGDCELFLAKLAKFSELYDVVVYGYCLMPNHFHLFLRTIQANLSKFMQSFLTSFAVSMNRKRQKTGHLFQGRYKAQLVESELYKNKLSRYIHLNPIHIKGYEELPSSILRMRLAEYEWSSYRSYLGLVSTPNWLDLRFVLAGWGKTALEKVENYREYVEQGLFTDNSGDVTAAIAGSIIGSKEFRKRIVGQYLSRDVEDIDSREQPLLADLNAFKVDEIIEVLMEYYSLKDVERITLRRGACSEARKMAMFLVCRYCRRKETLTSLSGVFGVRISGLNMATDKFKSKLENDKSVRDDLAKVERMMKNRR